MSGRKRGVGGGMASVITIRIVEPFLRSLSTSFNERKESPLGRLAREPAGNSKPRTS